MTVSTFRELTTDEHALLDRLLRDAFPGKPEIEHQLRTAQVRQIDPEGSLELDVADATAAGVVHRIPVEAMYKDSDGVPVHILFHVVNGKASELEIFKSDGSEIHRRPRPNDLEVTYATDAG